MRYQLLGALRIADPAPRTITAPKVETLFATLLIRANHTVTTDELIAELWGENPPRHARTALHVYVSQIRKQIPSPRPGAAVLHTKPQGYQMEVDENLVDAVELQRMHALGRSLLETDPEAALVPLRRAVGLFRGPVLAGIRNGLVVGNFAEWAEEVRVDCLHAIGRAALATNRHRELIGELVQWVEEHPLHEPLREVLMVALTRAGRRAEALAAYQSTRRVLHEELGLEPGEAMRRLQLAILSADVGLVPAA
ncbi:MULTISPECIES: AfsR/SARP family transcriptional regulator [Micromonospora]|uniref:SARP family pathway specific transcriptional activator n=1 Tax=Verrucosispora sp. MS100047 TaxID=1410949 RepID=A0A097CSY2_9ACTN|nr:AfsR/SARP family transcriptional regulator [Verrucosispora sp. FIM060022]AIS85756.1 SARP family pathway specific transcriptional activator [Verrucosispora sp. MS100047]RUL90224.1 SARP family transcriptional regulator [Verrucosispora sp. FIM060022]